MGDLGSAGTIAWVYPGPIDRTVEDFFGMTPPDVNVVIYTKLWALKMMHGGSFDKAAFAARREEIVQTAVDMLEYKDADCVLITGDLIQAAMGPQWTGELVDAVEQATGKPTVTAMTALTDALEHLGASRVAVATPWRPDQNEHPRRYLEEAGFTVAAIDGYDTQRPNDVLELDPRTAYTRALEVFRSAEDADAIYIACPLWRGATEAIAPLEQETGVPVLAFFNPILWRCLRSLGYTEPVADFGRLLAEPGREPLGAAR
ncbi:MAG TPA: hypothetical protein VNO82_17300 [Solirubrobacteraceae bacterium]|nr:hypothetical protein [Solirubrobacteraceae bacterium]